MRRNLLHNSRYPTVNNLNPRFSSSLLGGSYGTSYSSRRPQYCHYYYVCCSVLLLYNSLGGGSSSSSRYSTTHVPATAMAMVVNPSRRSNTNPRKVAIIGGGIAGLSCAQELSRHTSTSGSSSSFDVTVYDTGRLRPGGRCSSRQPGDKPKDTDNDNDDMMMKNEFPLLSQFRFDHAAQLISIPSSTENDKYPAFTRQLKEWIEQGIVKEFPPNSICQIMRGGKVVPIIPTTTQQTFYHATQGMGSLATNIVKQNQKNFHLEQDVWVSPSSGVRYQKNTGLWKLQAKGKTLGYYDDLIIAHNGKCADRIMSQTPATDLHQLLRVNFNPTVPANGGTKMTLNSLYSLTIVIPKKDSFLSKALPEPFQCGFTNHPQLRMISCQTRKYPSTTSSTDGGQNLSDKYEVWNILSSAKFGKTYKGPQEALPPETVERVTTLLLQATMEALGLEDGTTKDDNNVSSDTATTKKKLYLEARVQLWGAAVPLNVWPEDFLWDSNYNVGVCGDWLVEPSIVGAYTSGYQLAQHLLLSSSSSTTVSSSSSSSSHGLNVEDGTFIRSEGSSQLGLAALTIGNSAASTTTATTTKTNNNNRNTNPNNKNRNNNDSNTNKKKAFTPRR